MQMGRRKSQDLQHKKNQGVTISKCVINLSQLGHSHIERSHTIAGVFASVGFKISPNPSNALMHHVSSSKYEFHVKLSRQMAIEIGEEEEVITTVKKSKKKPRFELGNDSLRRLISGGVAGAVSRCAMAPLETIKTHLMVGSCGDSMAEVFGSIMATEGWRGLYRGNLVNVVRVTPNKAIELFVYDTVKNYVGEERKLPVPASLIAGAAAGFSSTLCTYPLELLKTRLTVQRGVYNNSVHMLAAILRDEGAAELYRGLVPSLMGVMPYAAANYCAYDTLRKAYKRAHQVDEIGNVATLLIGSLAAAISSSATFPLEVARKQLQAGAVNGLQYRNIVHALTSILEREGIRGMYRGLGPSCMKLVPAAGISFMCYEACKKVMIEN